VRYNWDYEIHTEGTGSESKWSETATGMVSLVIEKISNHNYKETVILR
jgi:hypothetical protein